MRLMMEPAVDPEVRGNGCSYVFVYSLQNPELSTSWQHLAKGCIETGNEDALEGTGVMQMQGPGCCMC